MSDTIIKAIEAELPKFAGFLKAFEFDEKSVRTVRETEAKNLLRNASMNTVDRLCQALRDGNLDFLSTICSRRRLPTLN
jgi:hypothetical protein